MEEEFQGLFEDQALYIKVGLQAPVFVASGCWSRYRQHPNSSWNIHLETGQRHPARVFFLNWIAEYLYEQGVEDVETWKLLQVQQQRNHDRELAHLKRESDRKLARLKRESDGKLARPKRDRRKARRRSTTAAQWSVT
jgi:hypothetical protein